MKQVMEMTSRLKYAELIEKNFRNHNQVELSTSFYFVYDVLKGYYTYLEDKFYDITGYPPSLVVRGKIDFVGKYMHPEDFPQYGKIIKQWEALVNNAAKKDREKIKASYDFRLTSSTGNPVRLLYQTLHVEFNCAGQMLYIIGKCSDISHWNKQSDMVLTIAYPEGYKHFLFPASQNSPYDAALFSSVEKKIIKLLSEGLNSQDIAGKMDITFNTANTHRRNMLRKARVRNTSELVSFAHCHHLV